MRINERYKRKNYTENDNKINGIGYGNNDEVVYEIDRDGKRIDYYYNGMDFFSFGTDGDRQQYLMH